MDKSIMPALIAEQKSELTSHHLYRRLSASLEPSANADILRSISSDELRHHDEIKKITGADVKPSRWKVYFYYYISVIFGVTFGVKLLEKGEEKAISNYQALTESYPQLHEFIKDEEEHEKQLIDMIDEERLQYIGSIVLGLNDALVELTGALAGFTFAFQNTRLIALTGLIVGISASFSMASAEYLSNKQENSTRASLQAAMYTGAAYVVTVVLLILPYLLISNPYISLGVTLLIVLLIIFFFNYYVAVAKDLDFKKRFLEMAAISLGVAGISFLVGVLVKQFFGIDI
ncbi:nodulin 21-related [hydrocarbon metagenome]|uniref:Nodulin 21-related n=1 Tax=hydrocarbon metagenome TaxID=938273 RepID=A0A0W8EA33_9ZZZZ